jgi:quaternary ammonium compound-resistance protein SugE
MIAWVTLVVAGIFEIIWAFSMKLSNGFTRPIPSVITLIMMIVSFGLLSYAMRTIPLGTAYMVWTGIGAVGAFAVGIAVFGEELNLVRMFAAILIVGGLVLMKYSTPN